MKHFALQERVLVPVFFAVLLIVGIAAFKSYSISWDEKALYMLGLRGYEAVFEGKEWPTNTGIRFHGPVLEMMMTFIERNFMTGYARNVFFMRHFFNFLTFYFGVFFFYILSKHHLKSWSLGLLGATMLVLSPRIFGHAFFNSRDIPTMSFFILSIYTLVRFLEKRNVPWALVHGAACALLASTRMTGIYLPPLTAGFLALGTILEFSQKRMWPPVLRDIGLFALYFASACVFLVAIWPLLWENPLKNFSDAYAYMSQKSPGGFYFGARANETPWHWIPVWLSISTPFLYTVLFLAGSVTILAAAAKSPIGFLRQRSRDLLFCAWFFGVILAIIVLRAGIFDEWRHVYFIYPAFLLIALTGVRELLKLKFSRYIKQGLSILFSVTFILTAFWMVVNHPLQYIYFSIPSKLAEKNFELDYWGLAIREGLEFIDAYDDSPFLIALSTSGVGWSTMNILTEAQRYKISLTAEPSQAKYFIDNFRGNEYKRLFPEEDKIHSVKVDGMEVLAVYRNPNWQPVFIPPEMRLPTRGVVFFFDTESI